MSAAQLLVRPAIKAGEGLRGYVCRQSDGNDAAFFFKPMMDSLRSITTAVPEISQLTCESRTVLLARGSLVESNGKRSDGCRFGNAVLPAEVLRTERRAVCPLCVAQGGVAQCVWDLCAYDVCHRHGVYLAKDCHSCGHRLSWKTPSLRACACGSPIGQLPAARAPSGRARFCAILAEAMLTSLNWDAGPPCPSVGRKLPIDWALLLEAFLSKVMLPRFVRLRGMSGFDAEGQRRDELIAAMLEDCLYRDYIRDTLFLHAAADPMSLLESLRPDQDAQSLRARFDPCWRELSFHKSLWSAKQRVQRDTAQRAVRRLMTAGALRAVGREHVVSTVSSDGEPPVAWCNAEMPVGQIVQSGAEFGRFEGLAS